MASCPHLEASLLSETHRVLISNKVQKIANLLHKNQTSDLKCSECNVSFGNVWLCLDVRRAISRYDRPECSNIGCGRSQNKHALTHFESHKEHPACINIATRDVYCYSCDEFAYTSADADPEASSLTLKSGPKSETQEFLQKIADILAPPMPQRESSGPASTPQRKLGATRLPPGLCGLSNLGNTCYMNSALQCLSNTPPLTDFFLNQDDLYSDKTSRFVSDFSTFMKILWSGEQESYSPANIVRDLFAANPLFRGFGQQDSQECLRCIVDLLHEQLKEEDFEAEREYQQKQAIEEEQARQRRTEEGIDEPPKPSKPPPPRKIFQSIISTIFEGTLLSRVQCLTCGHISDTRDAFHDFPVSIPDKKLMDKVEARKLALGVLSNQKKEEQGWMSKFASLIGLGSKQVDLLDCMHGFCSTDELTGADKYKCEKCKRLREARKTFAIEKLPEMLCVFIKRFKHDSFFGSKISDLVDFPMENLDVAPFCVIHDSQIPGLNTPAPQKANGSTRPGSPKRRKRSEGETPGSTGGPQQQQQAAAPEGPSEGGSTLYDLVGLINHSGSLGGGHYISYCMNNKTRKWYCFDDRRVYEVSVAEVKQTEAYILFYRRKPLPEKLKERAEIHNRIKEPELQSSEKRWVSRFWFQKFRTMTNPGPIRNVGLLCKHFQLRREVAANLPNLVVELPRSVYETLQAKYGGEGVDIEHASVCKLCLDKETLMRKRKRELAQVKALDRTHLEPGESWYIISQQWLSSWLDFAGVDKSGDVPGPIANSVLFEADGVTLKAGLKRKVDYRGLCPEVWEFFHGIYGGEPVILRSEIDIYGDPVTPPPQEPTGEDLEPESAAEPRAEEPPSAVSSSCDADAGGDPASSEAGESCKI